MSKKERAYYLDWIRICVVLLLIPFHSAVSFSHIGKGYVYSDKPINSFFYIFISDYLNLWFMRMLFFISGIASYYSFKSKKQFLFSKIKRLVLPVVFVVLTIGPISGYILAISKYSFSGSFFLFYPQFFINTQKYLFWGHMWFCVYLFTFSLLLLPIFSYFKGKIHLLNKLNIFLKRGNNIFLPMLIIVLFEVIFRPYYPGMQKLIGDWANFFVYISFFSIGFIIGDHEKTLDVISKKKLLFLLLALLSSFVYIVTKRFFTQFSNIYFLSALWGVAAYSWVMFYIGLFKVLFNKKNIILNYLNKTSFSLYVFHYLIVSVCNFILLKYKINHYYVWLLSTILSFLVFFIIFELIIKRIKILKFICGIK